MKTSKIILTAIFTIVLTTSLFAQTALELLIRAEDSSDNKYCIELAKQVIALAEKENDKGLIASANGQIAICLMNLGQLEDAENLATQITAMAESTGDPRALYYEWSVKGSISYQKKDYTNAILCFEKALPYSQKHNDSYYTRTVLISLVNSNLNAGNDATTAIEYCNQALSCPDSKRDPNSKSNILSLLADIYYYFLDNSRKAIDYYNQAYDTNNQPDRKAQIAVSLALVHEYLGNANTAIETLQKPLNELIGKISNTEKAKIFI